MQKLLLFVDKVSTFVGQAFSWLIVALTLLITWEVFSRYVLDRPHAWAFDVMIMMYGTLFMMAGAYTLAKNSHVRGDVLYGFFPPRLQAGARPRRCTSLFFIPGVDRVRLGRLHLCRRVLGDQRAFEHHGRRPADLPVQDGDPDRRGVDPAAGHRRDHPLRHLPEAGRLAVARGRTSRKSTSTS